MNFVCVFPKLIIQIYFTKGINPYVLIGKVVIYGLTHCLQLATKLCLLITFANSLDPDQA